MNLIAAATTRPTMEIIRGSVIVLLMMGIAVLLAVRALKKSEDPAVLIVKWLVTAIVLGLMIWKIVPIVASDSYAAVGGIILVMACGWVFAILWSSSIASIVAKPFGALYDGGSQEAEARPAYSAARAKRNRGNYNEAVAEIRQQLARFPTDFEGQLLLAEIQAENLNDLPGAEVTIHRLCSQPGHAPRNVALVMNYLADWHLKYFQDRDAARQDLEKIIEMLPDTEMAALAAQRIGHLASKEHLLAPHDRKRIIVTPGVQDVGLLSPELHPKAPVVDPAKIAAEYVKHLEEHPLDTEIREKLAVLYAEHYARLDLAMGELEQLIQHPNQPARRVVHWLNLLADLQVQHGADYDAVRGTLQRIIDLFPDAASAQTARNRIDHLKLEIKGRQEGRTVALGTYEQDIGLKMKR